MFCEKLISTVTMQGREAEHVQIASYAKNSLFKDRRHDYISKLWLPIHQPSLLTYHQTKESLIPLSCDHRSTASLLLWFS